MLFFDCEVLKHDWMVVFLDMDSQQEIVIVNDSEKLSTFYEDNKERIWCGYNARHYDQYIIKSILLGIDPYWTSTQIIEEDRAGWMLSDAFNKVPLLIYDAMVNRMKGLKELEAHMGNSIKESNVSFKLQRKCTAVEIAELIEYCKHDVYQTVEVFMNQLEEYQAHIGLLTAFNLPLRYLNKTKAQLSAIILNARKSVRNDEFNVCLPDTLKLKRYKHIADWYLNPENHNYEKFQDVVVAGCHHIYGWGGVHGALDKYYGEGFFVMSDVASLYPAIMIEYDFLSRNVKDPSKYRKIRDDRLVMKAQKNPMQLPMKIVLNGTYGASKDKNNALFDPLQANNVCIAGMTTLTMLIEMLEDEFGSDMLLVQSNTDGILVKLSHEKLFDRYKKVCDKWSELVRLDLEHDIYKKVIQKDVNNYVIIDENGKYKSKGAYVKKLNVMDYDLPIVNRAVVDYLVKGIPVEETINNENRLKEFQKIVKVSSKFNGGAVFGGEVVKEKLSDGKTLSKLIGGEPIPERVLRVFASRSRNDKTIYKLKDGKPNKVGNTAERCFIFNDDVNGVLAPRKLDKGWYIDTAKDRLQKFLGYEV